MKNNKLRILIISLLITVLFSGCRQTQESSSHNNKKEIKVAISAEVNPPYLYTNKQNEFAGLDIDYLKLLGHPITINYYFCLLWWHSWCLGKCSIY